MARMNGADTYSSKSFTRSLSRMFDAPMSMDRPDAVSPAPDTRPSPALKRGVLISSAHSCQNFTCVRFS